MPGFGGFGLVQGISTGPMTRVMVLLRCGDDAKRRTIKTVNPQDDLSRTKCGKLDA